jgi:hypothetical protein
MNTSRRGESVSSVACAPNAPSPRAAGALTGAAEDNVNIPYVAGTFLELSKLAKWEAGSSKHKKEGSEPADGLGGTERERGREELEGGLRLSYTINLNLPATTEIEVFNAIFKSLRENLLRQ